MKICLVTSEVTYIRKNYRGFIDSFIESMNDQKEPVEILIVFLKNKSLTYFFKSMALYFLGVRHFSYDLFINNFKAYFSFKNKYISNYPCFYFNSPNEEEFHQFIKEQKVDLIVNARTRYIYKKKILNLPPFGCINIHHGLLPDNRGTMCDLHALNNSMDAGFTIHKMNKKIDDGEILIKQIVLSAPYTFPINYSDYIYQSSCIEGKTLALLMKDLIQNNIFPKGMENKTLNNRHFKNPDKNELKKMQAKGIVL